MDEDEYGFEQAVIVRQFRSVWRDDEWLDGWEDYDDRAWTE